MFVKTTERGAVNNKIVETHDNSKLMEVILNLYKYRACIK